MHFANSPLLWILTGILFFAIIQGVMAYLGYRRVREDARAEYDFRKSENMRGSELSFEKFEAAYLRVNAPRARAHTAAAMIAIVLLSPISLRLADLIMKGVHFISGEDRAFEPPFLVYQVGVFFLVIASWALIGYIAARRHHSGTAISFDEEIRREAGML